MREEGKESPSAQKQTRAFGRGGKKRGGRECKVQGESQRMGKREGGGHEELLEDAHARVDRSLFYGGEEGKGGGTDEWLRRRLSESESRDLALVYGLESDGVRGGGDVQALTTTSSYVFGFRRGDRGEKAREWVAAECGAGLMAVAHVAGVDRAPSRMATALDSEEGSGGRLLLGSHVCRCRMRPAENLLLCEVSAEGLLAALRHDADNHGGILFVQRDTAVRAKQQGRLCSRAWGPDRVDQRGPALDGEADHGEGLDGRSVSVYVLDTGVRSSHRAFRGGGGRGGSRAVAGFDAVGDGPAGDPTGDRNGHGTHVASLAVGADGIGIAPGATVVSVRVLDDEGTGFVSEIAAGLQYVLDKATVPAVVQMSLGSEGTDNVTPRIIEDLEERGIPVVIAAGNEGVDACRMFPANIPSTISVSATTLTGRGTDRRANFANVGSCVDIFAPGTEIRGAWVGSDVEQACLSGTSQAAPFVSGVIALILQTNPHASVDEIKRALDEGATRNAIENTGAGSPNLFIYSRVAEDAQCLDENPGAKDNVDDKCGTWAPGDEETASPDEFMALCSSACGEAVDTCPAARPQTAAAREQSCRCVSTLQEQSLSVADLEDALVSTCGSDADYRDYASGEQEPSAACCDATRIQADGACSYLLGRGDAEDAFAWKARQDTATCACFDECDSFWTGSSDFPWWAIAVLAVSGFVVLTTIAITVWQRCHARRAHRPRPPAAAVAPENGNPPPPAFPGGVVQGIPVSQGMPEYGPYWTRPDLPPGFVDPAPYNGAWGADPVAQGVPVDGFANNCWFQDPYAPNEDQRR